MVDRFPIETVLNIPFVKSEALVLINTCRIWSAYPFIYIYIYMHVFFLFSLTRVSSTTEPLRVSDTTLYP